MGDHVTLDDVAELAGVSRATASRALNGRPGVKEDVRTRTIAVAEFLGFRPNRSARNLASGRSSVIGLVLPSMELRVDPYGSSITHAVGRAAVESDQGLMLHLAEDDPRRTVASIRRDAIIDGLLISSVAVGHTWADELLDSEIPTVLIGTHPTRTDIASVDVENVESSASAVAHLFEQGCRKIGMVTGPLDRADSRARITGYRLAHERARRKVNETLMVSGDFTRPSGAAAAATLARRGVDGVFASNDEMAVGLLWAFAHQGIKVPDDIAVVGFDGTSANDLLEPTLSSVVQPFDQIARSAVRELLSLIAGNPSSGNIQLKPELMVGGSSQRRILL